METQHITSLPYRRGVGIMLLSSDNSVFVGQRSDSKQNAWQMPQGGIDDDETVLEAGLRELYEETGIKSVEILYESPKWYYYDLPSFLSQKLWEGKYRGQKQKWILMRFLGEDSEINLSVMSPEFAEWRWLPFHELPKIAVNFKRPLYKQLVREFSEFLKQNYLNGCDV